MYLYRTIKGSVVIPIGWVLSEGLPNQQPNAVPLKQNIGEKKRFTLTGRPPVQGWCRMHLAQAQQGEDRMHPDTQPRIKKKTSISSGGNRPLPYWARAGCIRHPSCIGGRSVNVTQFCYIARDSDHEKRRGSRGGELSLGGCHN